MLDIKRPAKVYCHENFKNESIVSIDQIIHYIAKHKIGRIMMKTKNNRREEFLIDSVFISDRMIRACFYLSKMTVADEIKDGQMEFTHIKFVEFLEFIGRLSHAYYETTSHHLEWLLHEKIEYVLGLLFKP